MKNLIKPILFFLCFSSISLLTKAQSDSEVELKDLAVPNSPAFLLMEVAPSNIEAPVSPKEFTLGLVQNFSLENKWFNNYSMEFTPYWWVKSTKRSVYSFIGLDQAKKKFNPWSGLKLASASLAFITKDMIPDSSDFNQKIASVGVRTTVLKFTRKQNAETLLANMDTLNTSMELKHLSLDSMLGDILNDPTLTAEQRNDSIQKVNLKFLKKVYLTDEGIKNRIEKIRDLIEARPCFNLDAAFALAEYGIGDTVWKTGRTGGWLTASSFIPLTKKVDNESYVDILASVRYLSDQYVKSDEGKIGTSSLLDIGFKLGVEVHRFSLYGEGIWRSISTQDDMQNRLTAILNYRIKDDLYLSGTYGTDFGPENSIIALFGVNWGFGSEKVDISKPE